MNLLRPFTANLRLRTLSVHTAPCVFPFTVRNAIVRPAATRTMASNTLKPHVETESESISNATAAQSSDQAQESSPHAPLPLPLPEPTSDATQLNVNGEGIKLDHLGPLVVNKDGSLSRIANWDKMAEIEKQNTLRILGKRNQLRLGDLRGEGTEESK